MPRKARLTLPGEIHHIMARGIDGEPIFHDINDKSVFVSILSKNIIKAECKCYAWVIMPNHYHILVRPMHMNLSTMMRRINCSYAQYFNTAHNRRGYVFQDRFKSLATQEYWYFRELIRYIHLNPLRAGLKNSFDTLHNYKWSGHPALMGSTNNLWMSIHDTLSKFGTTVNKGRQKYIDFLTSGIGLNEEEWKLKTNPNSTTNEINPITDERIVGEAPYVKKAINRIEKDINRKNEMKKNRKDLDEIFEEICIEFSLSPEELLI